LTKSPQELRDILGQMYKGEKSNDHVQSLQKFCKEKPNTIEPFHSRFIAMSDKLEKNAQALLDTSTGADISIYSHLRPLAKDMYPDMVNKLLLDGVKSSALCVQEYHESPIETDMHLTWLCLNSGFRSKSHLALFNIITAMPTMAYWQELAIRIPM